MEQNRKFDLEDRLIKFAIRMMDVSENLPCTKAGNHIAGQLVRSGTSPALNYGEVQAAESKADFTHKMKVILKELRETLVALKIIKKVSLFKKIDLVENGMIECNELISIFVKSIETARRNNEKGKK